MEEEKTIEELLTELREKKQWNYMNIVEELNKVGINVDEKKVKKWEYGLEYPDLDTIYKLSEIYFIASEIFVNAKSNSYKKGLESVHVRFIKWFCFLTGISLKIGYIGFYVIIGLALIGSFMFFLEKANGYIALRQMVNH